MAVQLSAFAGWRNAVAVRNAFRAALCCTDGAEKMRRSNAAVELVAQAKGHDLWLTALAVGFGCRDAGGDVALTEALRQAIRMTTRAGNWHVAARVIRDHQLDGSMLVDIARSLPAEQVDDVWSHTAAGAAPWCSYDDARKLCKVGARAKNSWAACLALCASQMAQFQPNERYEPKLAFSLAASFAAHGKAGEAQQLLHRVENSPKLSLDGKQAIRALLRRVCRIDENRARQETLQPRHLDAMLCSDRFAHNWIAALRFARRAFVSASLPLPVAQPRCTELDWRLSSVILRQTLPSHQRWRLSLQTFAFVRSCQPTRAPPNALVMHQLRSLWRHHPDGPWRGEFYRLAKAGHAPATALERQCLEALERDAGPPMRPQWQQALRLFAALRAGRRTATFGLNVNVTDVVASLTENFSLSADAAEGLLAVVKP
jgi:hypothetical protein